VPARVALNSPVRVVHVVQNLAIGGLERVVLNLATHADRAHFEPSIVCLGPGGPLVDAARSAGLAVHVLGKGAGFHPTAVLALARTVRREHAAIVHGHNAAPLVYSALAARLTGAAVVYTAHGMKTSGSGQPVTLDRWGWVDGFVTVSDDARNIAIQNAHANPARVQTILNGVDTRLYRRPDSPARARARGEWSFSDDAFVFGIVARLARSKDHANLFRAFAQVAVGDPGARLLVVGDGELRQHLERLAHELKVEGRIVFAGSRTDVPDLLRTMDCFVLSSHTEGLAMTLLEATATELPLVVTRVGGNAEVVVDGETGLVVPARDPSRLAEAMQWMATHRAEAREMGRRGRERALARFSIDAMVAAYEDVYRRALARRRP
jgi:sugar transferase (PEP-CTERM/EpsH1 system associated)